MTVVLGKQDLLTWASQVAGVSMATKYDELKDGYIFLCLCEKLWPAMIDHQVVRSQKHGPRSTKLNWEVIRNVLGSAGLPLHLCDRKGVAAGHQRPCYNMLVMFYFLSKLQQSAEFSVDFAHPIDDLLATFLQSPQSLQCVGKGPAAAAAAPSSHLNRSAGDYDTSQQDDTATRSVSPAHPVPSPNKRQSHAPFPSSSTPVPTPRSGAAQGESSAVTPGTAQVQAMVPRLRAELHSIKKSKELLQLELQHVKQLSKITVDQQRSLIESELARAQEQFQTHLVTVRMELHHEAEQASYQCFSDYNKAQDEIAMERHALVFDDRSADALRAELLELRQLKHVLSGKNVTLEQELHRSKAHASHLKEALEQQRLGFDKLYRSFSATVTKLAGPDVPKEALLESLSPAEQQPIVTKIAMQQQEIEALRARVQYLEHEMSSGPAAASAPNVGGLSGASDETERARLVSQLERATHANAFLSEQLSYAKSRVSSESTKDLRAIDLSHGILVPSCSVGATTCAEVCGEAMKRLADQRLGMSPEVFETIRLSFLEVTLLVQVLQSRVECGGQAIQSLHQKLLDATRQTLMEKHQSKKELHEVTHSSQARIHELAVEQRSRSEACELALQLAQGELQQVRAEHDHVTRRLQQLGSSVIAEFERLLAEPKEKNALLHRQVTAYRSRDQLLTQLVDAYRTLVRSSQVDKAVHESRVASITNQLSAADPIPANPSSGRGGSANLDVSNEIKEAMAVARVNVDKTIVDIMAAERRESELRDVIRSQGEELASLRKGNGSVKEDIRRLHAAVESAQQDAERYAKSAVESEARAKALDEALRALGDEMRRHLEEVLTLRRPPGAFTLPVLTNALPQQQQQSQPSALSQAAQRGDRSSASSAQVVLSVPQPTAPLSAPSSTVPTSTITSTAVAVPTGSSFTARAGSAASSSIMTPEELERRKQEILSKYGVKK